MVSVKMTFDDKDVEMNGRMALAIVADPARERGEPVAMQASIVGKGNSKLLIIRSMETIVSLANSLAEDPVDRSLLHMAMMQTFKNAVFGDGMNVEVVRKEISDDDK